MRKAGRKSYDWRSLVVAALQRGATLDEACVEAGVHRSTVTKARHDDAQLDAALTAAGIPPPGSRTWLEPLLEALRDGHKLNAAARLAGVSVSVVEARRRTDPAFAAALETARADARQAGRAPLKDWQEAFLARLGHGESVQDAAAAEHLALNRLLSARRRNAGFAAAWREALDAPLQQARSKVSAVVDTCEPIAGPPVVSRPAEPGDQAEAGTTRSAPAPHPQRGPQRPAPRGTRQQARVLPLRPQAVATTTAPRELSELAAPAEPFAPPAPPVHQAPLEDVLLPCRNCGGSFAFTQEQQRRYQQFGWTKVPELCPACEKRSRSGPLQRQRRRG